VRSTPPHPALRATFSHGRRKWVCVFCLGGWVFVRKGRKSQFDDFKNGLEVLHNVFVAKSEDFQALSLEPFSADLIGKLLLARVVIQTIKFDHKFFIMTIKIESVSTQNLLPYKFPKLEPSIPQSPPQSCFRRRQLHPCLSSQLHTVSHHKSLFHPNKNCTPNSFSSQEKVARSAG
jgi:hypothetical protein